MSYELLLNELETLQKGYTADADDRAIQAAAAEAGDDPDDNPDDNEMDADGKPMAKKKKPMADPGAMEGKPFGKSFTLVGDDGVETEAFDGTEFVKSLHGEVVALTQTVQAEKQELSKSLEALVGVIKSQGALIKSLQDNLAVLSNQGSGRKSMVMPSANMAKSIGPMNAETFMTKANAAFAAGRISGKDLTVCDVSLRQGEAIDNGLMNKIFAA